MLTLSLGSRGREYQQCHPTWALQPCLHSSNYMCRTSNSQNHQYLLPFACLSSPTQNGWVSSQEWWSIPTMSFQGCMPLISLSTQYKWKPLYFCISNISHQCGLIATHCTNTIPPAAHMSLHNCSLMLCLQVTPFTQHHFNIGLLVHDLRHFQQFRWCLIEPATVHTQQCSQNLVKPAPPPFYCGDTVVLFIVLYCITTAAVSHLIRPVAGMTSHTTHHAVWLSSQVACLYSLLFSCSTLPLMRT